MKGKVQVDTVKNISQMSPLLFEWKNYPECLLLWYEEWIYMKTPTMIEQTIITLPKSMPLSKRISAVSREISEWLRSLEEPFNVEKDVVYLARYKRNGRFTYHYVIERDVER